ncbi:piggyBac transposable element-derived protein 4-like [Nymphalis io]|uniref:piggyBac transposable element-derived protein 4-like n=1 Tax=Inachis io TaxID=171585 RepID=UPI0021680B98|nr:piggyBac transposable element-derived protein 4-like [Nymphalis io]
MTTTEELIRILEGDENEEFLSDEEFDIDEEIQDNNVTTTNWTTQIATPMLEEFDDFVCGLSPAVKLDGTSTELDFFEHFCSKGLLQKIANCTNKYHQHFVRHTDLRIYSRLQQWRDVSIEDLYIFLAVTMLFTRNKRITIEEHWSTEPLLHSMVFHNTMFRNRYCSILGMLSFYEAPAGMSSVPRSHKIKMMIDHARETFKTTFIPAMNAFKKCGIWPFNQNNLTDSDFSAASTTDSNKKPNEKKLSPRENVVLTSTPYKIESKEREQLKRTKKCSNPNDPKFKKNSKKQQTQKAPSGVEKTDENTMCLYCLDEVKMLSEGAMIEYEAPEHQRILVSKITCQYLDLQEQNDNLQCHWV